MKINEVIFPYDINKKNSHYFYIPYILMSLWIVLSIISVFMIGTKNLFDGFVIFSIIIRVAIGMAGSFFLYRVFIKQAGERKFYNYYRAFIGYGIVFTYVFYSLPRMVGEFNGNIDGSFSIFSFLLVLIISAFPVALYIFIRYTDTRIVLGAYTQKDVEFENKLKKDKKLKKKEQIRIRSERSLLENLWYDWIDVIVQAIIIALIIQQFVFQMYQIPSESMVPTFLIGDRVVVNKAVYGPHIPLTDWKLPSPIKPKVGDIVVFKNPEAYDDPGSDLRYKNVFVRIFHPFIYMLTLSFVDIDKKDNGEPKERFLVKRLIANEGEKLCIVNDKVYKKTKDTKWTEMSQLQNQREYGQVDLYYNLNPKMQTQNISKEIRSLLSECESFAESQNINDIKNELSKEKEIFLAKKNNLNNKTLENILSVNKSKIVDISSSINKDIFYLYFINRYKETNPKQIETDLNNNLNSYNFVVLYNLLLDLKKHFDRSVNDKNYFEKNIMTDIKINDDMDPYKIYMKKINALTLLYQLKLFNKLDFSVMSFSDFDSFAKNEIYADFHKYYLLSIYIRGIPDIRNIIDININYDTENKMYYINNLVCVFQNNFTFRNFPEYPAGDNYINKNEYFVMGDNRYNSLDMRFGRNAENISSLDEDDNTEFSVKFNNDWMPHTITINHILGKAVAIYWPMNRSKFLK